MPPKRVAGGAAVSRGGVGGRPPEAVAAASASSEAVAAAAAAAGKMKFPTVTLDAEATRRSLPWLRARHLDAFFQLPWDAQHSRLISDFLSGYDEIAGCAELRGYRIAIDEPTIQEVFHLNSSSTQGLTQGLTQDLTQGLEQGEETDSTESFRSMFKPGAFVESNGWSTSLTHDPDIGYCLSKVSALLYLTTKPTYVSDNILSDLEAAARGTRSGTGVALAPPMSSPPPPRWSKILTSALQRNCARLKQHNSGRSYAGPHITMLVRHFCPLSDDEVLQLGGGSAASLLPSKRKRIPLVVRPAAPPPQPPPEPICCEEEVDQTMDRASEESDIQVERNPGLNQPHHHHHHQSVPPLPPPPPPHSAAVTATVAATPLVGSSVPSGGASPLRQDLDHALQVVARFAATAWTRDEMQSHLQGMQQQLVAQGGQIGALQHQVDALKQDVAEERAKCNTWRGHMVRQQEETRALRHELGLVKEKLGSATAASDRPKQDHPPTGAAEELERIRAQANPVARAAVLQLLRENDELKARIEDLHTQLQLAGGGGGGGGVGGVSRMPKKEAENIRVTEQR